MLVADYGGLFGIRKHLLLRWFFPVLLQHGYVPAVVYGHHAVQLSEVVCKYPLHRDGKLYSRNVSYDSYGVYDVAIYLWDAKADDEDHDGFRNVSFLYEYDGSLPSYDTVWPYQPALGTDFDLCGGGSDGISDAKGIFRHDSEGHL